MLLGPPFGVFPSVFLVSAFWAHRVTVSKLRLGVSSQTTSRKNPKTVSRKLGHYILFGLHGFYWDTIVSSLAIGYYNLHVSGRGGGLD